MICTVLLALYAAPAAFGQEDAGAGQNAPPEEHVYVVKKGDTLYSIARQHGLSVAQLKRLNDLTTTTIQPGQKLAVPAASEGEGDANNAPTGNEAPPEEEGTPPSPETPARSKEHASARADPIYGSHVAKAGATFYTIAARYGTSVDSLASLNDDVGTFLPPGARVLLPASLGPPTHKVAPGETIYDVARRYSVSAKLLQRTNDLKSKHVSAGQYLRIPGRSGPQPQPPGTRPPVREAGPVARYPASYEGRLMAGGQSYDPQRFTAGHPSLPLGTVVLLTNPKADRHAFAIIADRGPLDEKYVMDVSAAVFERLGLAEGSEQPITVRVMD